MITQELLNWVLQCMEHGADDDMVIYKLINNGYPSTLAHSVVYLCQNYNTDTLQALCTNNGSASEIVSAKEIIQYKSSTVPLQNSFIIDNHKIEVAARNFEPHITVFDNFLTHAECDLLVEMSREKMRPSMVLTEDSGNALHDGRTSKGTFYHRGQNDTLKRIEKRISALVHLPYEHGEGLQILNYQIGQEYKPHYDYFSEKTLKNNGQLHKVGNRTATFIIYLNEVQSGGSTSFPELDFFVYPKKGSALFFEYGFNGQYDPMTFHGGEPVVEGEKWVATKWFREKVF